MSLTAIIYSLAVLHCASVVRSNVISVPYFDYEFDVTTDEATTAYPTSAYEEITNSETNIDPTTSFEDLLKTLQQFTTSEYLTTKERSTSVGYPETSAVKYTTNSLGSETSSEITTANVSTSANSESTVYQTSATTSMLATTAQSSLLGKLVTTKFLTTTSTTAETTTAALLSSSTVEMTSQEATTEMVTTEYDYSFLFEDTTKDYEDWTTGEVGLIAPVWSIWDEAWIWILIGCLIFIFIILIPTFLICFFCCGCFRCRRNNEKESDSKSIPDDRISRDSVPIYESFPHEKQNEENKEEEENKDSEAEDEQTQESNLVPEDDKEDEPNLEHLPSVVIDIEDPLKDHPISSTFSGKPAKKSHHKARSLSGGKPPTYEDYPKISKANSVGSQPLQKTATEVKLNIGNEAIIGSNAFHPTGKKYPEKMPKASPVVEYPVNRPEPRKRRTLSPTTKPQPKKKESKRKEESKKKRKPHSDRRKRESKKREEDERARASYSKQKQLLKTANSLESLLEAITSFTKEYPIPESHTEPLKHLPKPKTRRREEKRRSDSRRRRDKDRNEDRPRRSRKENDQPRARPRARQEPRDKRTMEWAKQQQRIRKQERRDKEREVKSEVKKPERSEKPSNAKSMVLQPVTNSSDTKDSYQEEQRRKQLEKDLKKMRNYCNKVIPKDEVKAT